MTQRKSVVCSSHTFRSMHLNDVFGHIAQNQQQYANNSAFVWHSLYSNRLPLLSCPCTAATYIEGLNYRNAFAPRQTEMEEKL